MTLCQLEEWFPRPGNQNRITSLSFLKLLANKGIKQWPPGKKRLPECTSFVRSSRKRHHPGIACTSLILHGGDTKTVTHVCIEVCQMSPAELMTFTLTGDLFTKQFSEKYVCIF